MDTSLFRIHMQPLKVKHAWTATSTPLKCLWNDIFDFEYFGDSDSFWGPEYCEHICFWFQQLGVPFISFSKTAILGKKASGPRAARTACVTSLSQQRWHPQAVGVWNWLFIRHFTMFKRSIKLQSQLNTLYLLAYKNTTLTSDVTFGHRLRMPFYFNCSLSEWGKRHL